MVKTRGILPCRWSCGVGSDDNHFTIGAEAIDERGHGLGARSGGVDDLCAAELLELGGGVEGRGTERSEEHTSELQSRLHLVCRLLLEKKKTKIIHMLDRLHVHRNSSVQTQIRVT